MNTPLLVEFIHGKEFSRVNIHYPFGLCRGYPYTEKEIPNTAFMALHGVVESFWEADSKMTAQNASILNDILLICCLMENDELMDTIDFRTIVPYESKTTD